MENTKHIAKIFATVELKDGSFELLTSWFSYTTPRGYWRARRQHHRYIRQEAQRRWPSGWSRIDYRDDPVESC